MGKPRVSVILPTYNRIRYLPEAVQSVRAQTEDAWELIVADDGSTDATPDYLATLDDPRIRVLRLPHAGHPGQVRNTALSHARADYVAFLDSDDWWEPQKLAVQLEALAAHPDCGWSYALFRFVDAEGRDVVSARLPPPAGGMVVEHVIVGKLPVLTTTVLVERRLLEDLGGFDTNLPVASDLDLWVRLALRSRVVPVPMVLAVRRLHPGHYARTFRDDPEAFEKVFRKLHAGVESRHAKHLVRQRRASWLVSVSSRLRAERRYRDAWRPLLAALPSGLRSRGWWVAVMKVLVHPLVPSSSR